MSAVGAGHDEQKWRTLRLRLVVAPADEPVLAGLSPRVHAVTWVGWDQPADASLVVMSEAAVADPGWNAALTADGAGRLVPIALDGTMQGLPQPLQDLNWIPWDPGDLDRVAGLVDIALRTDPSRYRAIRVLELDTAGWLTTRKKDLLIIDRGRIKAVDRAIAAGDPLARPSPGALEYLAVSRRYARRKFVGRAVRGTARAALAAGIVVVLVLASVVYHTRGAANRLVFGTSELGTTDLPDLMALKAEAAHLSTPDTSLAGYVAAQMVGRPWRYAEIGSQWEKATNGVVLTDDGVVTADGAGTVTWWTTRGTPQRRIRVGDGAPLFQIAGSADGAHLVASGATKLATLTDGREDRVLDVPFAPTTLSVSRDGAVAGASDESSTVVVVDGQERNVTLEGRFVSLVALESTVGALVVTDEEVRLVDLATGTAARKWRHSWPVDQLSFLAGSTMADGDHGFIAGPDGELWTLEADGSVSPTGEAVPVVILDLSVTPQGWALIGGEEDGAELLAPQIGLPPTRVCDAADEVDWVEASPDGSLIACTGSWAVTLYRMASYAPVDAPPPGDVAAGSSPLVKNAEVVNGTPFLTMMDGAHTGTTDSATLVSLHPNGRTFAVARDYALWVDEVTDTDTFLQLATWSSPTGRPITVVDWPAAWDGDMHVTTSDGLHWRVPSCAGCLTAGGHVLVDVLRRQLMSCYPPVAFDIIPAAARRQLGIEQCATTFEVSN